MKKIIAMLLVAMMVFGGSVVSAEGVNLATMTTEELLALHEAVDAEIDARIGCEPSAIGGGVYTAGETIKPGVYIITCAEAYAEEGMQVQVYADHAQYEEYRAVFDSYKPDYQLFAGVIMPGESVSISLSDGMVMVIDGGFGHVQTVTPSWAP